MFPQVVENQQLFRALKTLLEDLRLELREDEHARLRLQQQYASDKAAWDMEWAMLKCRLEQVPLLGLPRDGWRGVTLTQVRSDPLEEKGGFKEKIRSRHLLSLFKVPNLSKAPAFPPYALF